MNKYRPSSVLTLSFRSPLTIRQSPGRPAQTSSLYKAGSNRHIPTTLRKNYSTEDRAVRFVTSFNSFQTLTGALLVFSLGGYYLYQQNGAMSSKLIPSDPSEVMVIRDITPNVATLSVPFARFGMIHVGGRATLVRLSSGRLAVFSPVALTPDVKAKLAQMGGTVGYIVAPDFEHHIFISDWAKEYPEAKIIGPEGLPEKRSKAAGDDKIGNEKFDYIYTPADKQFNQIDEDFAKDFEVEYMESHPNKEIIFFYKPDRVLIEADLLFNLPAIEQYSRVPEAARNSHGLADRLFGSVQNTSGDAKGMKRFMWYVISAKNRSAWNQSIQRIDQWDFATIIPCHGETMEGDGKEIFRKVFEWHLLGHK